VYSGEKGRVIAIIETEADYTDYLLFSPTGELESSALISDAMIMGDSIEFLIKKVIEIILDFRIKLLEKLYSCKKVSILTSGQLVEQNLIFFIVMRK